MIPETYRTQYRAARQHKPLDDSLESIAAQIALQDRRLSDRLGEAYRFALDLKGELTDLRDRIKPQKARSGRGNEVYREPDICAMIRELAAEMDEPQEREEVYVDLDIRGEFDSVYDDR